MATAIEAIRRAMARYPELTYVGFGLGALRYDDRLAGIRAERDRMLTPAAIDEFQRAQRWLEQQPRTKNVNRRAGTSYGLKPEAEGAEGGYISNGMFIAAAIACGFKIEPVAPESASAWLNMSVVRPTNPTLELTVPGRRGGAR
jgi:hypothetical protein